MQITKPSKQRKMLYQAPLHARRKHFSAPLSSELKASHRVNALPVRSGDTVRIMRGDHRGFEGKITRVDSKKYRVFIEGLTREKVDGTTIFVSVHPSKIMITHLNLEDKWRKKILERKREAAKELEKLETEKLPREVGIETLTIPVEKSSKKKTKPKRKLKNEEKPKLKRKRAPKKAVKKKEVKREKREETKAKKQKALAKKAGSKLKSSRKTTTSGRTKKSRRTVGGK